jgi:hypothetical protein
MILIVPVGAAHAADGLPSDPEAGSPAGTVYRIPLDSAREDAAPRRAQPSTGRSGDPASDAGTDSPIRSENRFGSSAQVPGVGDAGVGRAEATAPRAARGDGAREHLSPTAVGNFAQTSALTDEGAPSAGLTLSLLGLIAAVGAGVGLTAARARRAR